MRKFSLIGSALTAALVATAPAAFAQDVSVGFVSPIGSQPGQAMTSEVMAKFAAELGWDYRMLDANLSADRQVSHVGHSHDAWRQRHCLVVT